MSGDPARDLISQALTETLKWDGGLYMAALGRALREVRPHFVGSEFRTSFREHAVNREWFASLLASNTYMEGYSAGRLKQYAGVIPDPTLKRNLMRHAEDEARHSREFSELIFQVFPDLDSGFFRAEADANVVDLNAITPCPDDYPKPPDDEILNSLILMNLFEIKALYLGSFLKPFAAAHAPDEHAAQVRGTVGRIVKDECFHIAYTARHIDAILTKVNVSDVADRMAGFIDMINRSEDYHLQV